VYGGEREERGEGGEVIKWRDREKKGWWGWGR